MIVNFEQRGGYRQHLVQALAEAASGPVPLSALLPILRAKETGPSAADLALEVLEKVAGLNCGDLNSSGSVSSGKAVLGNITNTGSDYGMEVGERGGYCKICCYSQVPSIHRKFEVNNIACLLKLL